MKTPTLKCHVSGRAYARSKGKCTYFGKYGTEAAQQRFQQWLADMDLVEDKFQHVSLLLLASKFMEHAKERYRKNGVPTGEANNIQRLEAGRTFQCLPTCSSVAATAVTAHSLAEGTDQKLCFVSGTVYSRSKWPPPVTVVLSTIRMSPRMPPH
ncbi:MAG: hypothetical protein GY903_02940 [Fuerstiella sp.]|nr:hypothetical protein [Fuerstiella sp.]MCP4853434.1 hypothetical protein [Fuerstiella sp.]